MRKKYIAGGVVIETDLYFQDLVESTADADIQVVYGAIPDAIENPTTSNSFFSCNDKEALLLLPGIVRFHIIFGSRVVIGLLDENRKADGEAYVLTVVLAVLSYKKGFFPLHGGGVVHNGEAYLFTGRSGAGKSTTIAGLVKEGFQPLADDIANLFLKDGKIFVHPCFPRVKLWSDSMEMLDYSTEKQRTVRSDVDKYLVAMEDHFPTAPVPVKGIYFLKKNEDGNSFFQETKGMQSYELLRENVYKPWMVKAFDVVQEHFSLMGAIAQTIQIKEFHRPFDKDNIDKMYAALVQDIRNQEKKI
ncbi:MAG: hypothetical protein ACKOXB_06180 [Flavobacteriales bacterium]